MGFDASLGLIIRLQRLVGTYNVPVFRSLRCVVGFFRGGTFIDRFYRGNELMKPIF